MCYYLSSFMMESREREPPHPAETREVRATETDRRASSSSSNTRLQYSEYDAMAQDAITLDAPADFRALIATRNGCSRASWS